MGTRNHQQMGLIIMQCSYMVPARISLDMVQVGTITRQRVTLNDGSCSYVVAI